ncbi:4-oxalocrotonate tautomerase [Pseudoroseomonas wenyumeiae]|uniref:4-oxalocrotonate tautomerase n=2 Tax=Teichococcus wenyumeiae TaxID=2478470 RepID=A0A3A9JYP4_9PROT|nr:4-oxalocrotonate tautomerase [Pseudoroseomonas wenyumeiae]RMI19909.1 4-oxalocrotonate tautomerase [Pseudoroseomonas wenyumeiae]
MPKMFIHAPEGTFDLDARTQVASELTELGLRCEAIPATAFVRSAVWLYFSDYPAGMVFSGGQQTSAKVMSLLVYVLEGGLDSQGKQALIAGATEILGRHAGIEGRIPAYVCIREVPESNWGIFGAAGSLEALRASPEGAVPI